MQRRYITRSYIILQKKTFSNYLFNQKTIKTSSQSDFLLNSKQLISLKQNRIFAFLNNFR